MSTPEENTHRVLAIPGSLRLGSFNRALARTAALVSPPGMQIEVYEQLGDVPLFNGDLESDEGDPAGVVAIRDAIDAVDGVLIATPEYNRSVPGVVKNLLDWLSRRDHGSLKGKPTAVIGATPGMWGTRTAQSTLGPMLMYLGARHMVGNDFYLPKAATVTEDGVVVDEATRTRLEGTLSAFADWIEVVQRGRNEPNG